MQQVMEMIGLGFANDYNTPRPAEKPQMRADQLGTFEPGQSVNRAPRRDIPDPTGDLTDPAPPKANVERKEAEWMNSQEEKVEGKVEENVGQLDLSEPGQFVKRAPRRDIADSSGESTDPVLPKANVERSKIAERTNARKEKKVERKKAETGIL
eukprot:CAMPEP_0198215534 /NCGR_PEP_ID=MMETSP1445-20131203/50614_1 /TAXON_ID=36898 /ORGANISM="Pyramimonas sp., Strain CCMP2087" /LENGTH=153 /DNA_ID=CAMNT_0043891313 /DNA_START=9 /DNA_END=470 /DNA_ORIENTATION=-